MAARGSPLLGSSASADSDVAANIDNSGTTTTKRADLFMTDAFLRCREIGETFRAANTMPRRLHVTPMVIPAAPNVSLTLREKKHRQFGRKTVFKNELFVMLIAGLVLSGRDGIRSSIKQE